MKFRFLVALLATLFAGMFALVGAPAQATETNVDPCKLGTSWYVNPDESANAPTRTMAGFVFEGKDLIHHATRPIDLPDIKTNTGSFDATAADKVVFKMETDKPYSTIVQNADGKFWSTAMTYDQDGGQGHPVANVSDLVGKDTKPGKAKFGENSHVVTFGVGYWVEEGQTTVTSITFHGTKYDLTCKPVDSASASPSASVSVSPKPTGTTESSPKPSKSISAAPVLVHGPSLPVTGPGDLVYVFVLGALLLSVGLVGIRIGRRKKTSFEA